MKIKIAITDDHPLIIHGLSQSLLTVGQFELTGTYGSAKETKDGFNITLPNVLLLDIGLPDDNGINLCAFVKQNYPGVKVLALTSFGDLAIVKSFMQRGGDGYLLKTSTSAQLIEAIEKVMKGEIYLHPEVQRIMIAGSAMSSRRADFIPKLTSREKEVLQLIADEYTTPEIADKLSLSVKTIETHRQNLFQKFGCRNSAGLIKTALERGML